MRWLSPISLVEIAIKLRINKLRLVAPFGVLFPALASLAARPDAMRRTFQRSTLLVVAFAVSFGLTMTLFGDWLLRLTFDPNGATFAGAVPVLILLAWALLPSLLRAILTLYLYSLKRERFVNIVTLIALAFQALAFGRRWRVG